MKAIVKQEKLIRIIKRQPAYSDYTKEQIKRRIDEVGAADAFNKYTNLNIKYMMFGNYEVNI